MTAPSAAAAVAPCPPPGPVDVADRPVDAALVLADALDAGGRLLVFAPDAPDHAHHVAVEFVHPVIAGLPALPAEVVDHIDQIDHAGRSGRPSRVHGGPADVVLAIGARAPADADLLIDGALPDARIMAHYHLLWELVHVALDHRSRDVASGDSTGFLYPFLDDPQPETDDAADEELRAALESAAASQRADSVRAGDTARRANRVSIDAAAAAIARAATPSGARVYVIGNGGSATDAARMVRLLGLAGVRATSLAADYAVVTALANDLGAERVFARQIDAFVRPGDVVVGWSTSGTSANVVAAFERAAALGATCIGSCGYGGAALDALGSVAIALVVDEQSVHRIQEAQADLMRAVVDAAAARLESDGTPS